MDEVSPGTTPVKLLGRNQNVVWSFVCLVFSIGGAKGVCVVDKELLIPRNGCMQVPFFFSFFYPSRANAGLELGRSGVLVTA